MFSFSRWRMPALAAVLLLAGLSSSANGLRSAEAASDPTPSDLLAATATTTEVGAVLGTPGSWVAWFPQFEVPGYAQRDHPTGWVASTTADIRHLDAKGHADGLVSTSVVLYPDEAAAKAAYAELKGADEDGTAPLAGVATIGNESRAFTFEYPVADIPEDAYRFESFVRFRVGRAVVVVDTLHATASLAKEPLVALATPVATRVNAVLAGTLKSPALPSDLASLFPATLTTDAGPLMGESTLPIRTFALLLEPLAGEARLTSLGGTNLADRVYEAQTIKNHTVRVQIFALKDEASARDFVLNDAHGKPSPIPEGSTAIPTGNTGPSAIAQLGPGGAFYEFQFARNKYVANIQCSNPMRNGTLAPACETLARKVAESIYAGLPASTATPTATSTTPAPTATTVVPTSTTVVPTATTAVPTSTTAVPTATTAVPKTPTTAPLPPNTGSGSESPVGSAALIVAGMLLTLAGASTLMLRARAK